MQNHLVELLRLAELYGLGIQTWLLFSYISPWFEVLIGHH